MKLRLYMNNIDRTSMLLEENITIDYNYLSTIDTLAFTLLDASPYALRGLFLEGKDVLLEDFDNAAIVYFSGIVTEVQQELIGLHVLYKITCQDWTAILDKTTFVRAYSLQTDYAIIQDAFAQAGMSEIDTTTHVNSSRIFDRLEFIGQNLSGLMDLLSSATGFVWYVDQYKKLHYHRVAKTAAIREFTDVVADIEDPLNFNKVPYIKISRNRQIGQFNAIQIRGMETLSADTTQIYGGNGVRVRYGILVDALGQGKNYQQLTRAPSTASDEFLDVEINVGTEGTPDWVGPGAVQEVRFGRADKDVFAEDAAADVLWFTLESVLVFRVAPPNFATNSFRVTGRFASPNVVFLPDEDAIVRNNGRQFVHVISDNLVKSSDEAYDIAKAFIREQGPKETLSIEFDTTSVLNVTETIYVTSTILGITRKPYLITHIQTRILGGQTPEYSATLQFIQRLVG
jgi:hypothetical protein